MKQTEEIAGIIRKYDLGSCKFFYAPEIPDSVKLNITKNVDNSILIDAVVASIDTTVMGKSCRNGIVFTLCGLYNTELFGNPVYVNYGDIESVSVIADKKGNKNSGDAKVELKVKDVGSVIIENSSIRNKDNLCRLIEELIEYNKTWDSSPFERKSGKVEKIPLDPAVKKKCNIIIHSASAACGGVGTGLAQIPLSDTAVITPIQIGMIISLAAVFGLKITKEFATSLLAGFTASFVGRGVSQVLVGWIPGLGNVINTATAAVITEAIGWSVVNGFYKDELENKAKYSLEGQKKGYLYASAEYENKLKIQAELFEKQERNAKKEFESYKELLGDYESYIKELESKSDLSDGDKKALADVVSDYEKLKKTQVVKI
ncbi:MAG: hypothetical protein IKO57_14765 [Treponema sp.]|nr:hypothetical protein [Treponema sp.]